MNKLSVQLKQREFPAEEREVIDRALAFATKAHEGQKRKSGEDFIIHPVAVADKVAAWGLDYQTVAAALLHDTVEDTDVTTKVIAKEFGDKIAELVDGVTKLGMVEAVPEDSQRQDVSNENLRKLLLAMSRDIRVIIIKLADRLHNLSTLKHLPAAKQRMVAQESLEVFAPLADRLGMGELKAQIEDLSFRYGDPETYHQVEQMVAGYVKRSSRYIAKLKRFIRGELEAAGIEVVEIEGRQKHLYSVYKKLLKAEGDIDKIYDLIAVRIIVSSEPDCYKAMGILHQDFKPLIGRIKDYIAVPKPNGYRSLHTTVFALDGHISEIQIRTSAMHNEAEKGLAAHFYYDAQKSSKGYTKGKVSSLPDKLQWVNQLTDLSALAESGGDFEDSVKLDLFQDRIFVFSPKGDIYDLPAGSTPVDFAFAIHSDVGLRIQGATVNGRMVPIDFQLDNRDVVDIKTRKQPAPNRDWLSFVRTPQAKNRIRAWYRAVGREANVASGRDILESELKIWGYSKLDEIEQAKVSNMLEALNYKDMESVLAAIGEGALTPSQVTRRLFPSPLKRAETLLIKPVLPTGKVVVAGSEGLSYSLAPCCMPHFPQSIIGFITRGKGVTVHAQVCSNLPQEAQRFVRCHWQVGEDNLQVYHCKLQIQALNRVGLLRDLTTAISAYDINIQGITSTNNEEDSSSVIELGLEAGDMAILAAVIKKVERLPSILNVQRLS